VIKELFIESVGKVEVRKSRKNKRLILKTLEGGKLRVSAPFLVRDKHIIAFVNANRNWIERQQAKAKQGLALELLVNGFLEFDLFSIALKVSEKEDLNKEKNTWLIQVPETLMNESHIKNIIESILLLQANDSFPKRIAELSNFIGVPFKVLKINKAKTRWGSCSHQNNINLSCYMSCLSLELQDYIMIHELCHVIHKNHSADFWNLVENFVPDLQRIKQELSQIRYHL
jgi:predicted metal-dependent hydrolase